jgi:lipopolysaccharide biosynthesis glycosyltransferase
MNIVLVSDENYFCGLWATVLSLLGSTSDASDLTIYIVDSGISDASWEGLVNAVQQHPKPPVLLRKPISRETIDKYDFPGNRSNLTYARLFIPELLDCDHVLYLDADLLIFKDVHELKKVNLAEYACAAVLNEDGTTIDFDLTPQEYTSLGLDAKSNYFNAGVLYMNLDYWRSHNLTEKCLEYIGEHECRVVDQSAINAVMNHKILALDKNWNRLANFVTPNEAMTPKFIVHYTSRNPWDFVSSDPVVQLWKSFVEGTGFRIKPPQRKISIFSRNIVLNFLRMIGYALKAIWYSIVGDKKLATGYTYAFTYWLEYIADRKRRLQDINSANYKITNFNYAPTWLSCDDDLSVDLDDSCNLELSPKKLTVKGERITSLLRDRGRTRELISRGIQHRLESRLEAIVQGKKKLRVSASKSDVAVSLTSWPPRESTLPLVLLSILEQNLSPSKVYVWLSPGDRKMIAARHEDFFKEHGVEFQVTEDIVPHKKWLPFLELGNDEPFAIIDDDTYYPRDWFKSLVAESVQYPNDIVAHRCHKIKSGPDKNLLPYAQWEKDVGCENEASHLIFPTGCGGVMIRPEAISTDFRDRELIKKLCPLADDVWLKAAYVQSGYKCRKSHYYFPCLDFPGTRQSGLAVGNVDQGGNDQQLQDVFRYFDLKLDS